LSDVSFIKIDVEGHEEAVIAGAAETLALNRPAVLVESEHRHNPGAPRRLSDLMDDQGYGGFFLREGQLLKLDMIREEDQIMSNNPAQKNHYVYNYLFLPNERNDLCDEIRLFLLRRH
jgi:hypothetical protein